MITGIPKYMPDTLVGQRLGKYQVREIIGRGGMGVVFKVWDTLEDQAKAIKMVPPELASSPLAFEELKREISLASGIVHPNVVNVLSLEAQDGQYFIVMEYISGESLEKKIARVEDRKLPEAEVIRIMKKAAEGIIEAHGKNVIHRDLKPRNIMVSADGQVKILDFGVSHRMTRSMTELTGWGATGTWPYMAPEQLSNNFGRENQQVDVWGFGVTMYQLLSGEVPFKDRQQIVDLKENPFPLEGISKKTSRIVMKCLQKDREKRYQDMREVLEDLEEVKIEAAEREMGVWARFLEWPRVIAAATVLLALFFLFYALILNRTSPYNLDTAAAVEKSEARREYEGYMGMAEEAAARSDYAAALAYLDRAKAIAATSRLKKRTREISAELIKTDSRQIQEFIQGQAPREEKIEKCRQFLEKYKDFSDLDVNSETLAQISQIRSLLVQLQAKSVTLSHLPKGIIDSYYGKIRRIEIPGLPRGIQVLGRIRLRFQVTEKGQLNPLYIDDTGLNLTDQNQLKTINTMIIKKLSGISLAPPRDKSGSPVKVKAWEVTFKVGTFQSKIILLHEG
ncbi:MAG: protein kinase [Candidatus Aminicenantes bacterium]|nr:protein kinase [Candidatus Aminicenantes bacterium]NIM83829.1 protein kinase [Candidatus Aminicenantes bacterium]NIN23279.1 protein kinase [Candidatus Aminicenantes bacterium]NIN46983.1 protein kinase [Candidatus Aminicenantes bacterium]NIN89905.1 protein kinase [Candidatus Aminicenantes bacterium]